MMWMTPEKAMQTHDEHWEGGPPETEYHTTIRLTDQVSLPEDLQA